MDVLTIRLPGGPDEKYYFDVTARFLSMDEFAPDWEFYDEEQETDGDGFREAGE